jgi:hypothetical protein
MLWLGAVLACLAFLAPAASAVVVHEPDGQFLGVTPRSGANSTQTTAGTLEFQHGFVLHTTKPYLVFWDPDGKIPLRQRNLFQSYLSQTAADSQLNGDVYGVGRQYTDAGGFAGAGQSFDPANQVLVDTQPFPTTSNCTAVNSSYPVCVTDHQMVTELERVITAENWPRGDRDVAPVYFLITPSNVNVCIPTGPCADLRTKIAN